MRTNNKITGTKLNLTSISFFIFFDIAESVANNSSFIFEFLFLCGHETEESGDFNPVNLQTRARDCKTV